MTNPITHLNNISRLISSYYYLSANSKSYAHLPTLILALGVGSDNDKKYAVTHLSVRISQVLIELFRYAVRVLRLNLLGIKLYIGT